MLPPLGIALAVALLAAAGSVWWSGGGTTTVSDGGLGELIAITQAARTEANAAVLGASRVVRRRSRTAVPPSRRLRSAVAGNEAASADARRLAGDSALWQRIERNLDSVLESRARLAELEAARARRARARAAAARRPPATSRARCRRPISRPTSPICRGSSSPSNRCSSRRAPSAPPQQSTIQCAAWRTPSSISASSSAACAARTRRVGVRDRDGAAQADLAAIEQLLRAGAASDRRRSARPPRR